MRLIPVTLPAFAITIGMVADARFAASGARVPIARITSTLRLTSSAASSGKRSRLLSANLGSNAIFLPSVQPSSLSASIKIDQVFDLMGAPAVKTPIR